MSDEARAVVKKWDYWIRVSLALQTCVKPALLNVLHDPSIGGLPRDEENLHSFLHANSCSLRRIIFPRKWSKIHHDCSTRCTRPCQKCKTNPDDLDITSIVPLITNCTNLTPPRGNWATYRPTWSETSKAALVILARDLRNEINHCSVRDIASQEKFNEYWNKINIILKGLDFENMKLFNSLKEDLLDGKIGHRINALNDQIDYIHENQNQKDKLIIQKMNVLSQELTNQVKELKKLVQGSCLLSEEHKKLEQHKLDSYFAELQDFKKKTNQTMSEFGKKISNLTTKMERIEQKKDFSNFSEQRVSLDELSKKLKKEMNKEYEYVHLHLDTDKMASFTYSKLKRKDIMVELHLEDLEETEPKNYEKKEISTNGVKYKDILSSNQTDCVIITGEPGSGKTTLTKTLLHMWSSDDIWTVKTFKNDSNSPHFQFVFVLYLRELIRFQNDEMVTAQKILNHYYPGYFDKNIEFKKENALLLLEGLDEFSKKVELLEGPKKDWSNLTYSAWDLLDPNNAQLKFTRIVTGRTNVCSLFENKLKANDKNVKTLQIKGYSKDNVNLYISKHLRNKKKLAKKVSEKVNAIPTFETMMKIPFYCWGVCCFLGASNKDEFSREEIPLTFTALYAHLLTLFLRQHGNKEKKEATMRCIIKSMKNEISTLSNFAYCLEKDGKCSDSVFNINAIENDPIMSSKTKESTTANVNNLFESFSHTGLIRKIEKDDGSEPTYEFVHQIFQEFLTALNIFQNRDLNVPNEDSIITMMIMGLLGSLEEDGTTANSLVKCYAEIFKDENSLNSVTQYFSPREICWLKFLALLYEFHGKLKLDKMVIAISVEAGFSSMLDDYCDYFYKLAESRRPEIKQVSLHVKINSKKISKDAFTKYLIALKRSAKLFDITFSSLRDTRDFLKLFKSYLLPKEERFSFDVINVNCSTDSYRDLGHLRKLTPFTNTFDIHLIDAFQKKQTEINNFLKYLGDISVSKFKEHILILHCIGFSTPDPSSLEFGKNFKQVIMYFNEKHVKNYSKQQKAFRTFNIDLKLEY